MQNFIYLLQEKRF